LKAREIMQIESHTSFQSIKGMIMRMTFDNEKIRTQPTAKKFITLKRSQLEVKMDCKANILAVKARMS